MNTEAEPIVPKLPDVLYHYTSLEALNNMLRSQTIRLYSSNTMNDISEGSWIESAISWCIDKYRIDASVRDRFWQEYRLNSAITFRYLFCLTENGNDLNQWIHYGHHARGLSVGFRSANAIVPVRTPASLARDFHSLGLAKVEYDPAVQREIVDTLIFGLNLAITKGYHNIEEAISSTIRPLILLAITFKSNGFAAEQEWRVIDNTSPLPAFLRPPPDANSAIPELGYDIHGNTIREFTELPLSKIVRNGIGDVIEVIIGPDSGIGETTLREYLSRSYGMKNVLITRSSIPYRRRPES